METGILQEPLSKSTNSLMCLVRLYKCKYLIVMNKFLIFGICLIFFGILFSCQNKTPTIVLQLPPEANNPRNSEGDFITLKNGRILFIYSHYTGTSSSDHAPAYLAGRFSDDRGQTWSKEDFMVVANEGGMNVMSVSLLRLQNGSIALFYLRKNSETDCIPMMRISTDEAKTWSNPVACITDKKGYFVLNNNRVIQLKNGRLLLAVALHENKEGKFSEKGRLFAYYSDDSGLTWHCSEEVPNPSEVVAQEPGLIELKDGTILMIIRAVGGFQQLSFSKDKGRTWSPMEASNINSPLSPASIARIPSTGDLLLVWNNNDGSNPQTAGKRTPLTVAVSKDEGKSWQHIKDIEADPDGWFCYISIHFTKKEVLLGYCAGSQSKGTHLSVTNILLFSQKDLYTNKKPVEASVQTGGILLPEGSATAPEPIPHFPDRLHAFVWRNWNLTTVEKLAQVLKTTTSNVKKIAASMGLPGYKKPNWTREQIYITLIRRNWHLLPYSQLMELVDMTPERLNVALREDDFLWVKLGQVKPKCEPLYYQPPSNEAQKRAEEIKQTVEKTMGILTNDAEERFAFIEELKSTNNDGKTGFSEAPSNGKNVDTNRGTLRFIYSYITLFGDPLSQDTEVFPAGLLEKLSGLGVNGVWLHVLLRDLAPGGTAFPEFGKGHEKRLSNLLKTVTLAKKYGIDVYLYMNEPRAMSNSFFKNSDVPGRSLTMGVQEGDYNALCTSNDDVRNWLKDALTYVFTAVPGLGGVFTISGSENLTYCNSHGLWQQCPRCKEKTGAEVTADANALVAEGVHRASPDAKVIVWDWGWNGHGIATDVIEKLPEDVWLMSVSEWALPIERGGVRSTIGEYSISAVGPGPRAQEHWRSAKEKGLKTAAKVQLNCTWEIAAMPFVPVMDLIAEHCSNLTAMEVDGYLLSWSLGGYPSPNLEIPQLFDRTPTPSKEEALEMLALKRYGTEGAPYARKAWTVMSDAYREYPYSGGVVYNAPVQVGPANLFRPEPTGYHATMVGIPYDDLNAWRGPYPAEIFAQQFEKIAKGFSEAIPILAKAVTYANKEQQAAVQDELRYAKAIRIHFASVANQVRFVMLRDEYASQDTPFEKKKQINVQMKSLVENEIELTKELYYLTQADSRIGYEPSNQYFYVANDLLEKIISCRQIVEILTFANK